MDSDTIAHGHDTTIRFMNCSELPLSPRSQVLNNPDLLELVFSLFRAPSQVSDINCRIPLPQSQHLLWAALTCKAFLGPAKTILWHSLESWTALLRLIPTLELIQKENLYTTRGAILGNHLEKLDYYAKRVRSLKVGTFSQFVSTHIYASISKLRPNLFPGLSKLAIPNMDYLFRDNLNALFLVPAPSLSVVSIGGIIPATEVFVASLLVTLSTDAKFLEHLDVSGHISIVTTDLLDKFKRLRSLQLNVQNGSFESDAMQRISSLTSLTSFSLTLDGRTSFNIPLNFRANLNKLESLKLSGSMTTVLSILGKFSLPRLKEITINSPGPETTVFTARDSIQMFLQPQVASSLKSFRMDLANSIMIIWEVLIPLQSCKQLTHLNITSIDYLDVSRLTSLCCNGEWLALSSLQLVYHMALPGEVGLSLHDLHIFAEYCPKLTFLSISLETLAKDSKAIEMLWQDGIKYKPFANTELQALEILPLLSTPTAITQEVKKKAQVMRSLYLNTFTISFLISTR